MEAIPLLPQEQSIRERYELIGMTRRQLEYYCAIQSLHNGPGMPHSDVERIAQIMHRAPITIYKLEGEMQYNGLLRITPGYATIRGAMTFVHYRDFTRLYEKINALDEHAHMQEAQQLLAERKARRAYTNSQNSLKRWSKQSQRGEEQ